MKSIPQQAQEIICKRFALRRKELSISTEELSEITGLGLATIKRFEAGKSIALKNVLILCHHLELVPRFPDRSRLEDMIEAMTKEE